MPSSPLRLTSAGGEGHRASLEVRDFCLRDIAAFFASNRYALVSGFVAVSDLPLPWHLEKSCLLELNRLRRLLLTASKADATCPHFGGMHIFLVSRSLVFNHAIQS